MRRKGRETDEGFIPFNAVTEVTLFRSDIGATVCRIKHTGARRPLLIASHSINETRTAYERSPEFDVFLIELHRKLSRFGTAAVFYDGLPWLRRFIKGSYFFITLLLSFAVPGLLYLLIDKSDPYFRVNAESIVLWLIMGSFFTAWLKLLIAFPRVLKSTPTRYAPETIPPRYLCPNQAPST